MMNLLHKRQRGQREAGFTLPELLIVIVILGIVAAVIAEAFMTTSRNTASTTQRFNESHDAQIATAYLANDVQSAATISASACGAAGLTNLVNFADLSGATTVSYFFGSVSGESRVIRRTCATSEDDALVHYAGAAPTVQCDGVACNPGTQPRPNKVEMTIVERNDVLGTNDFTYTLRGTRRIYPAGATPPNPTAFPPLLGLNLTGPGVSVSGNGGLNVGGGIIVNSSSTPSVQRSGGGTLAYGSLQIVSPGSCSGCPSSPGGRLFAVPDPLAGLAKPGAGLLVYTDGNPTHGPGIYRTAPLAFPNGTTTLAAGVYVAEQGISHAGQANVDGTAGVLIFNGCAAGNNGCGNNGTFQISGSNSVVFHLSPMSSGPYAGITVWQTVENTRPLTISGQTDIVILGVLYAPGTSNLAIGGQGATQSYGSVIGNNITVSGNGGVNIG
jgi:prepilin-type N-terminal cleavage/methylation domain-containing protein